ncbi:LPP20 family lipoprotein [Idiomarina sp. UBA4520]|uniref:LPP20 family lipoprotein n=1 Tax=Idiomarina sp. UBA4520 TaxID=1946647 RepID=UPI000AD70D88|nr:MULTISPECIES: LPP20 family lipoprotein [unclassified Idiomarina]MBF39749.1 flagellar biosynthesis protein FlgP [Idiomarinaceae bacterium]|tara:strand:- start:34294 stop:34773 length:480 start_codon:yes stop_codon:yes gene_type:complete
MTKQILTLGIVLSSMLLSGCAAYNNFVYDQKHVEWETQTPDTFPVLNAVGYAPIEKQSGDSAQVKDLNAMRASKLAAYRELAEQVYGQRIAGSSSVEDWALNNDSFQASVDGVIRGAEVVKTYTVGEYYATELRLDFEKVHRLYQSTNRQQKVKRVVYY